MNRTVPTPADAGGLIEYVQLDDQTFGSRVTGDSIYLLTHIRNIFYKKLILVGNECSSGNRNFMSHFKTSPKNNNAAMDTLMEGRT